MPQFNDISSLIPTRPTSEINPAQWTYEKLIDSIAEFEQDLSDEEEVGGRIVGAPGPEGFFHIARLGYIGPYIIVFYGRNSAGKQVELHQHYTQLSVLLVAMPKLNETPRRIGFGSTSAESNEE